MNAAGVRSQALNGRERKKEQEPDSGLRPAGVGADPGRRRRRGRPPHGAAAGPRRKPGQSRGASPGNGLPAPRGPKLGPERHTLHSRATAKESTPRNGKKMFLTGRPPQLVQCSYGERKWGMKERLARGAAGGHGGGVTAGHRHAPGGPGRSCTAGPAAQVWPFCRRSRGN